MIPGPLALNLREWRRRLVPRVEVGELAGNCQPTRHRVTLWKRAAPRIGEDLFIKLFAHGAPEKNAGPLLADDGVLDQTLRYLADDCRRSGTQLFFVSAWHMWVAIDAIRRGSDPVRCGGRARRLQRVARVRSRVVTYPRLLESVLLPAYDRARGRRYVERRALLEAQPVVERGTRPRVPMDRAEEAARACVRVRSVSQAQISRRWNRPRGSAQAGTISAGCRRSRERRSTPTDRICARQPTRAGCSRTRRVDRRARPRGSSGPTRATTGGRLRRTARIRGPAGALDSGRSTCGAHRSDRCRGDRRGRRARTKRFSVS